MSLNKALDRVFGNPVLYVLVGTLLAITVARIYVLLGGAVTLAYNGVYLHHLFYGVIIVVVVGILSFLFNERAFRNEALKKVLALAFGFGVGLIIDESNLLILTGQEYSLSYYYSPYNVAIEFTVVLLLVIGLVVSTVAQTLISRHRKKR